MQEEREEKIIDIKGTLEQFIKADEPELSQEEAIIKFGENQTKKMSYNDEEDDENSEEKEHMKRIKKELLASLERVKDLEKKVYGETETKEKNNLKVKTNNGKQVQIKKEQQQEQIQIKREEIENSQQERE